MYKRITSPAGQIRLLYIQDGLNMATINSDVLAMQADSDIIALSISMTAGAGTATGVVSFTDISMAELRYATVAALIAYLNTTFKTAHSLLGSFNIAAAGWINYTNPEKFTAASITWDLGGFGSGFGSGFD